MFGYIYFFITSKTGMVVLIILPCAAIYIFEVGKIIYVVMDEKKKEENINNSENDNSENDKEKQKIKKRIEDLKNNLNKDY